MLQHSLYLGLGSNLGNRELLLKLAASAIALSIGKIVEHSSTIETQAEGFESEYQFLNMVLHVRTKLTPIEILRRTQDIEKDLGRRHKSVNGIYTDRPIDIDILFYDNIVYQSDILCIPHPKLHKRIFVLQPLAQIAPNLEHPQLNKSIFKLLAELSPSKV